MAVEHDLRDIRKDVKDIAEKGCAHKGTHENEIRDLWKAIKEERDARNVGLTVEREKREGLFMRIVIGVLVVVAAGVILNIYSTSAIVEKVLSQAYAHPAAVVQPRK